MYDAFNDGFAPNQDLTMSDNFNDGSSAGKKGDDLDRVGSTKIDLGFFVESPLRRPSLESNAFNDEDSLWTSSSEEGDDFALFGAGYLEETNQHGLFV